MYESDFSASSNSFSLVAILSTLDWNSLKQNISMLYTIIIIINSVYSIYISTTIIFNNTVLVDQFDPHPQNQEELSYRKHLN